LKKTSTLKAKEVYDMLHHIPEGRVTTYEDLAAALGFPRASRAIGRILHNNPNPIVVPCHRVVMSDGTIGGYAFGQARKKQILTQEGVRFFGNSMANFSRLRLTVAELR